MTKLMKNVIEKTIFITKTNIIRNLRQANVVKNPTVIESVPFIPENDVKKILKVAIIGVPNAGKSSLINYLMDRKVCAASSKVHTTRVKARAVFTETDSQIIFLDTPGIIKNSEQKRHNLENSFIKDIDKSLRQADIIGVVHDVGNSYNRERLDIKIIRLLESFKNTSSFLVLNKIDVLKSKRKLLEITRLLTENCIDGKVMPGKRKGSDTENRGWPYFKEVFMVSALTGDGLEDVKNYLISQAKPGKWLFPENVWTDQTPMQIIENTVKATLLDFLPQEIPYNLKPQIEYFSTSDEGVITTVVLVECPTKRVATLIAGESDGRLRQITEATQKHLQETFHNYVRLKIVLQPKSKSD